VPGITSSIGGLAYAGIPVTHRETNHVVTFVTGHGVTGEVPDGLDWAALARGSPALVFYMAIKHLGTITERLLAAGRRAGEPVAVISRATTEKQRVLESTLGRVAADVVAANIELPALVAIGEIVRLRTGLDWLGALAGRKLAADPLANKIQRDAV
jgi:uroporphyrin-III C-methyltransferase